MMLVDSHCHLNYPELEPLADTIARAHAVGVSCMQTVCTRMSEFPALLAIADAHQGVYASVGVHPCYVEEEPLVTSAALVAAAQHPRVIGLGETGLDFYRSRETESLQRASFTAHIDAAEETGLPLIVHTRACDAEMIEILERDIRPRSVRGVLHCFTGSRALAETALLCGWYISFSGILTFKNAQDLHTLAQELPLESMLLETDAPYLAPIPHRGKTNEPAYTAYTARALAELRHEPLEHIATHTTQNFFRLFSRVEKC